MQNLRIIATFLIGLIGLSANAQSTCDIPPTNEAIVKYSMDSVANAHVYMVQVVATKKAMPHTPAGLIRQYDKRVKVYRYFVMEFFFEEGKAKNAKALWAEKGYLPIVIRHEYGIAGA